MVHRLGNDHRRQAVRVGHLLRVTRLQQRQCRQEVALRVHETVYVGHVAQGQPLVKRLLGCLAVFDLRLVPNQCPGGRVVVEVSQLALSQLPVEREPLRV